MMDFENNSQSLLTFRVGPVLCCAPSFPVRSIITPPKLTHPPGSDASQPGIFKHGSHIVKVLDLRQKFGIEQSERVKPGNLIITILEKDSYAFWVDQILDVFDFPSEGWGNLPPAIPRGIFSRTLLLNKKIHLYSEFEKLTEIHDLGYLKHYIQQLNQQNPAKKTAKNDLSEKNTLEKNKPASHTSTTPTEKSVPTTNKEMSEIAIVKQEIIKKPEVIISEVKKIKSHNVSVIKKSVTNSLSKTSGNNIITPEKTSTIKSKETPPTKTIKPFNFSSEENKKPAKDNHIKKPNEVKFQTKRATSKNNTHIENDSKKEKENHFFPIILFLLFLFILITTGLYFLFPKGKEIKVEYNDAVSELYSTNIENTPYEDVYKTKEVYETINSQKIEKDFFEIQQAKNKNISTADDMSSQDTKNEITVINDDYRAEIIQDNNEITITLHQPIATDRPQESKPLQIIATKETEKTILIDGNNSSSATDLKSSILHQITIEPQSIKEQIPSKKIIKEVVHIVVKGDTLWAIAQKYVNNPFLYPELARLSNIRNPNRIYPGNRVRIRFIKN